MRSLAMKQIIAVIGVINMKNNEDKSKPITHYNPIRIIVGNYKAGDRKFLSGNTEVLKKLLHIFNKST